MFYILGNVLHIKSNLAHRRQPAESGGNVDHKTRSEILQRNERTKLLSGLSSNFGTALIIAGAGRSFFQGIDFHAILWFIIGAVLIWTGWAVLTLLESEEA